MIESLLEAIDRILSQGKFSWGAIITALLFFNKIQRNKEFRLRDQRVERNQRRIMEHLGVEGEWATPQRTLLQMVQQSLRRLYSSSRKETQQGNQRRKKKMKDYVKKLGRTKLQVYIVFTIVNIFTLFATLSGVVDVNAAMQPYMPFIDLGAQLAAGWIYTHYQGKVDVVTAQNSAPAPSDPNQFIQG